MEMGARMRKSPHRRPRPLFHALSVGHFTAHTICKITSCTNNAYQRTNCNRIELLALSTRSPPLRHFTALVRIRAGDRYKIFSEEKSATLSLLFLCLHYLYCALVRCRTCIRRCWLNYTAPPATTAAGKLAVIDFVLRLRDPALGPGGSEPDMHHSRSLPTDQGDLRHHSCSCRRSAQGAPPRAACWKRLAAHEAVGRMRREHRHDGMRMGKGDFSPVFAST